MVAKKITGGNNTVADARNGGGVSDAIKIGASSSGDTFMSQDLAGDFRRKFGTRDAQTLLRDFGGFRWKLGSAPTPNQIRSKFGSDAAQTYRESLMASRSLMLSPSKTE